MATLLQRHQEPAGIRRGPGRPVPRTDRLALHHAPPDRQAEAAIDAPARLDRTLDVFAGALARL